MRVSLCRKKMPWTEHLISLNRKDPAAVRRLFETAYPRLMGIASRYCKDEAQAEKAFHSGFSDIISHVQNLRIGKYEGLSDLLVRQFILSCVEFVKSVRSEYYVASTVYAI